MNLSSRPAEHKDFTPFFGACYSDACDNQWLRQAVEHEWRVLLDSPATLSMVVEDTARPLSSRLVGCAQLAFVTPSFVRLTRQVQEPWINARLVRPLPDISSPLLTEAQIARANAAGGLYALFTRWHRADRLLGPAEMLEASAFMHTAFQAYVLGYRYREILIEATGETARDKGLRAGFRLRCDYADYYRDRPPVPPPAVRPFLMGITGAEAVTEEGYVMGHYFAYRPPRLGLTTGEQAMLERCLRQAGLSEAALAREMDVPVHRVKNALRAAYARVSAASDLFPELGESAGRGIEKKRQLLQYLRDHPEELRPYRRQKDGISESENP